MHKHPLFHNKELLHLSFARDSNQDAIRISKTDKDVARHFYKVYPLSRLTENKNYTLQLNFNGTLIHEDSVGMYRSPYTENNKTQ